MKKRSRYTNRTMKRLVRLCITLTIITAMALGIYACGESAAILTPVIQSDTGNTTVSTEIAFTLNDNMQPATFVKKVDGDTAWFEVDDLGEIKVRFLAVDTPETVKPNTEVQDWGPEASEYTTERLESADSIYLEWDDASDKLDKYERYLAWIWVDGSLLQSELVERGLASVSYIYDNYKYLDALYTIEDEAKAAGVGIWSE